MRDWAKAWHEPGSIEFGSKYNKMLEELVNKFAGPHTAPHKPNGSALNQARTNEFFGDDAWQWREFRLSDSTGLFVQSTVDQSMQIDLNHTKLLSGYINENEAAILDGTHVVPQTYRGQPFQGGSSDGEQTRTFFEVDGIVNNDARHFFR